MRKIASQKKQAVRKLRLCVRESRKIARQINRKLDSLAQWNKAKQAAKNELVKLCLK
jgi:predicted Fe-S protein YdhL (DUF1289 family)